jgi:hypothetical protein
VGKLVVPAVIAQYAAKIAWAEETSAVLEEQLYRTDELMLWLILSEF